MCLEKMEFSSKLLNSECPLRKAAKSAGMRPKWKFVHMSTTKEAVKPYSTPTIGKYFQRQQKRIRAAKLRKTMARDVDVRRNTEETVFEECLPSGAMAPQNTTQYLMNGVYEDLKTSHNVSFSGFSETYDHLYCESMSPTRVYAELDSTCYENCLDFQQRNFEEMFGLYA